MTNVAKIRAARYKFGGGLKGPGWFIDHKGIERKAEDWWEYPPPATEEDLVLIQAYRLTDASPGNPSWYAKYRQKKDYGGDVPAAYLKHRPGAKPVLPKGVSRIEDIEGYLPDDE